MPMLRKRHLQGRSSYGGGANLDFNSAPQAPRKSREKDPGRAFLGIINASMRT
jgi:hypothetical protein